MAEDVKQNNDVNLSDVIKEQSSTIDTLVDKLKADISQPASSGQTQPIYQTTPQRTKEKKKPNYVLYIGIAAAVWFLYKKRGR